MLGVAAGPLLAAFLIILVEMTEVVALVFALSADHGSVRQGALGAVAGSATIAVAAAGFGALILRLPTDWLLLAAAVALAGFGMFLFRSTLKSYRRTRAAAVASGTPPVSPTTRAHAIQFAGGFSIGAIEMTEAVIVLLALTAAGYGLSALIGAIAGVVVLVVVAAMLHERVRRIKSAQLKLVATSLLLSFAVFWGGEAFGVSWPGADLILIPLFFAFLAVCWVLIRWRMAFPVPVQTKG